MLNFLNIPTISDDTSIKIFFLLSNVISKGIKNMMILWKETKKMWW